MADRTPQQDKAPVSTDPYGAAFADASEQYGVSEAYLRKIAFLESSGNPNARKGSSRGLMQFQPAAAREVGLENPYDPIASIYGAAQLAAENRNYLTQRLGREPRESEIYLAHQQGRYGAAKILENPDRPAVTVLKEFHKKPASAITANGGDISMSCGEFAALWDKKYNAATALGKENDNNIPVNPGFASGNTDQVARDVFGPSTLGDAYYADAFNDASQHTPRGHAQRTRDAAPLRQEQKAPGMLSNTFARHGFGDQSWPAHSERTPPASPEPPAPSSPQEMDKKRPEQDSPAPAFKHNIFTPMGNG